MSCYRPLPLSATTERGVNVRGAPRNSPTGLGPTVQVLDKLAAPNRGWRSPATLAAVVDGADLGGRGGALAGVLGQQLLHPRQMGAQVFQRGQFACARAG